MSMEWKCRTCGQWVSMDRARHIHADTTQPTLAEMLAAREAGSDTLPQTYKTEQWTPDHERRTVPDAE